MVTTTTPCVLVMKSDALIKRAFASLITMGCDVEVAVSEADDLSELTEDISKLNPNVIFLSGSTPLAEREVLARLLICHPGIKVVVVSDESNWLHIFTHEDKLLTSFDDLLPVIHSS